MQAGHLRHRITIQSRPTGQNELGEQDGDWDDVGTAWASIERTAGSEQFNAQQKISTQMVLVTMRFNGAYTVRPHMRVKYTQSGNERYLDILEVEFVLNRNREVRLLCKETL